MIRGWRNPGHLTCWAILFVALLNVAFLMALPIIAKQASVPDRLGVSRPARLPASQKSPAPREEPLVPVEKLDEALRLPRVDNSPTDEHSRVSLAAYRKGDYEKAFNEAVLALDPTPLAENKLYDTLTTSTKPLGSGPPDTVEKSNGRQALKELDETLQPIVSEGDAQTAARLNNAAAMLTLHL